MSKNRNRVSGGKKAVDRGKLTEQALDRQLKALKYLGYVAYDKTYPEVTMIGNFLKYTGKGGPDWIITLSPKFTGLDNALPFWLETKHISNSPNTGKMHRVHQYDALVENAEMGGLSGYLVLWRINGTQTGSRPAIDEWRYHPVYPNGDSSSVEIDIVQSGKTAGTRIVKLHREKAILVPMINCGLFDAMNDVYKDDIWAKEVGEPDLQSVLEKMMIKR